MDGRISRKKSHRKSGAGQSGKSSHGSSGEGGRQSGYSSGQSAWSKQAGPAFSLGPVQRKPAISKPGDPYEREADAVADKVTSGQSAPAISRLPAGGLESSAQRQAKEEEKPADQAVQRQPEEEEETPMTGVQRQEKPKEEQSVQTQSKKDEEQPVQKKASNEEEQPVQKQATKEEDKPVQKQATGEDEEEPVQAKAKPDQEEPVQRQMTENEDEQVQTQAKPEEKDVQTKAQSSGPGAPGGMGAAASRAIASKGQGRPMAAGTRRSLESGLGADLGPVRVHDSPAERDAAEALNARAFTHGNDIWLGHGESDRDTRLMAHEATHVVQQNDNLNRQVIQRAKKDSSKKEGSKSEEKNLDPDGIHKGAKDKKTGKLDTGNSTITFSEIDIPKFKEKDHRGELYSSRTLRRQKNYKRGGPAQRDKWKDEIKKAEIVSKLEEKIQKSGQGPANKTKEYVFRGLGESYYLGNLDTLSRELTVPNWGGRGNNPKFRLFDVDHIVELQLANWNADPWANTLPNMELLERSANRSSGSIIANRINKKVGRFVKATHNYYGDADKIKKKYDLIFDKANGRGGPNVGKRDYWKRSEIEGAQHLVSDKAIHPSNLDQIGGDGKVFILPGPAGGIRKQFLWKENQEGKAKPQGSGEKNWLKPFTIKEKAFYTKESDKSRGELGQLTVEIPASNKEYKPFPLTPVPVQRIPGAQYAGFLSKQSVKSKAEKLEPKATSPIRVSQFDITPDSGIVMSGQIIVGSIPIIAGSEIDFELSKGNLTFSKTFDTGEFKVPKPFTVSNSSLKIFASTGPAGLGVEGRVDFEVERLGDGFIGAKASTGKGFDLEGKFNFDSELFDPAWIHLRYKEKVFSADGELGIPKGKVPGVKKATIHASYDGEKEKFAAQGNAQLDIPGVEEGEMHLSYSEKEGFAIGGSFNLSSKIPGIKSGSVQADVKKRTGEEGYAVKAHGKAVPSIPGVATSIEVDYNDGIITIEGRAAYNKGLLSGSILIGVTNQPVDENGEPSGGEPTKDLSAYGGGTVSIQIAPWLKGTIGVKLLRKGEIEVSGTVGLPDKVKLFKEKEYKKNIFSIDIDIPIVGVSVAGQHIGIFATIGGGMEASAGIGPGTLEDLKLTVTYNPDHEENTTVTGSAAFVIPAHAGLRLYVHGGLGAGIPIVSASAGLEVGGELGLEGEARAGVQVDWTPATGLSLDAEGSIIVQPKFTFDVTGYVKVEADLLFTTIDLYSKRWKLASFEYGSNIKFGIKFPVHYQQGEPFDLSLSDIEFVYPDIDAKSLLSGLVDQIA